MTRRAGGVGFHGVGSGDDGGGRVLVDASGGWKAGGGCRGGFVIQPYLPYPRVWIRAPPPDGGTVSSVQGREGCSLVQSKKKPDNVATRTVSAWT